MTDLPPELSILASLIDAQPAPVREAFRYCLALAMVEAGKPVPPQDGGAPSCGGARRACLAEGRGPGQCAPSRRPPASGSACLHLRRRRRWPGRR
jgi:hypothetical protein